MSNLTTIKVKIRKKTGDKYEILQSVVTEIKIYFKCPEQCSMILYITCTFGGKLSQTVIVLL